MKYPSKELGASVQSLRSNSALLWLGLAALAIQFGFAVGHHHGSDHGLLSLQGDQSQRSLPSITDVHRHVHEHGNDHDNHHGDSHGVDQNTPFAPDHEAPEHECPTCRTLSLLVVLVPPILAVSCDFKYRGSLSAPSFCEPILSRWPGTNYLPRGPPALAFS